MVTMDTDVDTAGGSHCKQNSRLLNIATRRLGGIALLFAMDVLNLAEEFSAYLREPRDVVDELGDDFHGQLQQLTDSLADSPEAIADPSNYNTAKWLL